LPEGTSARAAAGAILQAALAQARSNARGAVDSLDAEHLHQLRVGLRRYRSALRLFRELLRKKPRRRLARRSREAMEPLGVVRDWDVCIEWLQAARAPQDLLRRARARREIVRESLESVDLSQLEPPASAWKKNSGSLEQLRQRVLPKARRQVTKRLRGIDWNAAEERHRLRIEVKRLRYATDSLGGRTHTLERLQDRLGELNDLAVARGLLAHLRPPASLLRKLGADERRLLAALRRQVATLKPED
jgi:CHAD domain-containing protein